MELVKNLETVMAGWVKDFPHLPASATKWIAVNAWWLVLIGVIIGAVGILVALGLTGAGSVFIAVIGSPIVGGAVLLNSLVTLAFSGLAVVLEAIAIKPLKTLQKKGWDLVFLATLVMTAGGVVSGVLVFDLSSILTSLLGLAISGYFLFEVRSHFVAAKSAK